MNKKLLTYEPRFSDFEAVVMIDKIKRLEICQDNKENLFVKIHLIDGEILCSSNSLKTLRARLEY